MFWFLIFVRFCLPQKVLEEFVSGIKAALNLTAGAPQDVLEIEGYYYCKKGKNLSALNFYPRNNQVCGSNNSILTLWFCCFNLTSPSSLWRVKQREERVLVMITLYEKIQQFSIHSIYQTAGHKTA